MREMPVRIVADGVADPLGARHRGVLPRGREGLPQPRAAADRRHHPPGPAPAARSRVVTEGVGRSASPEVTELTLKTGGAAGGARPPGRARRRARSRRTSRDDFLLYWSMLALAMVRDRSPHASAAPGTPPSLDNLTLGLARHAAATCTGCRGDRPAARRPAPDRRELFAELRRRADAHAGPETPRVGHLDPTPGLRHDHGPAPRTGWRSPRCRTPPASRRSRCRSRPPRRGLPQGMMFGAGSGREATAARARLRARGGRSRGPGSRRRGWPRA